MDNVRSSFDNVPGEKDYGAYYARVAAEIARYNKIVAFNPGTSVVDGDFIKANNVQVGSHLMTHADAVVLPALTPNAEALSSGSCGCSLSAGLGCQLRSRCGDPVVHLPPLTPLCRPLPQFLNNFEDFYDKWAAIGDKDRTIDCACKGVTRCMASLHKWVAAAGGQALRSTAEALGAVQVQCRPAGPAAVSYLSTGAARVAPKP